MFLLAIRYHPKLSLSTAGSEHSQCGLHSGFTTQTTERPHRAPIDIEYEIRELVAEVALVDDGRPGFVHQISGDTHQCVHADALAEEAPAWIVPGVPQKEGDGRPEIQDYLSRHVRSLPLENLRLREELFDCLLHSP